MPRWLWALLFLLTATLVLAGHRGGSAPLSAMAAGGVGCPMPPAFVDAGQPLQSDVGTALAPFRLGQGRISPLAGISLQARVLHREDYGFGAESRYSPTDLALGWGPMAAPGLADRLQVDQANRWYHYRWGPEGPPIPADAIRRDSSNMHMVPADDSVARALSAVRAGQMVRLDGWLVRIDQDDGWHWASSLSRDDAGSGACELVLVCSIRPL